MVLSLPKAAGGGWAKRKGNRSPDGQIAIVSGGGWRPHVAGDGTSVLCHRFSPLSSIQPSTESLTQPICPIIPIVTEM